MFTVNVGDKSVKIDVDPRKVDKLHTSAGNTDVPIRFEQDSVDFELVLKSDTDAELVAALAAEEAEVNARKAEKAEKAKLAKAKRARAAKRASKKDVKKARK